MKAIGFANKFYTLWEVYSESRPLGNGRSYIVTHHTYVKNISVDKETAFNKYPEAPFDENLRGHTRSWESTKEVWDNVDTYRFGKYAYTKISNFDLDYLAWYWDNIYDEDHKAYVEKVLLENGYEIEECERDIYSSYGEVVGKKTERILRSPEFIKAREERAKRMVERLDTLATYEPFIIVPSSNVDDEGYYLGEDDVFYHFQEVKEQYYAGFNYYIPALNGKGKRVKNKNVKVKKYNYYIDENHNNNIVVEILDFEIVK